MNLHRAHQSCHKIAAYSISPPKLQVLVPCWYPFSERVPDDIPVAISFQNKLDVVPSVLHIL